MQNDIILTRWMFCVLYGHVFLCSLRVPGPKYVHPALALNRSLTLSLYIKKSPHTIIIGHSKSLSERLANIMGFNFAGVNRMKRGPYSGLCVYCARVRVRESMSAHFGFYTALVAMSPSYGPYCTSTHSRLLSLSVSNETPLCRFDMPLWFFPYDFSV